MASRSRQTADALETINNIVTAGAIVDRTYLDQVIISGASVTDVDLEDNNTAVSVSTANQLIVFLNNVIQVPGLTLGTTVNYILKNAAQIEFASGDLVDGDIVDIIFDNSATGNVSAGVITPANISTTGLAPNSRYVIQVGSSLDTSNTTYEKSPNWQSRTAATFNIDSWSQYFIDTSSNAITATLPTLTTMGEEVSFLDIGSNLSTNNLTITPASGGSIQGATVDESLVVATNNSGFTLVHAGSNNWFLKDR